MANSTSPTKNLFREGNRPIIPFIEGDGIGADITPAMQKVVDAAVANAYARKRKIEWKEVLAGEKALHESGKYLPLKTLEILSKYPISIKGPLTTPVGSGIRSLNVALRQVLDLYSCIRPIRWIGAASPLVSPDKIDLVIFRENTEDVYAGVEFAAETLEAKKLIALLREFGVDQDRIVDAAAIGIKPMSRLRTQRHVRRSLSYALEHGRKSVTFMHKGNIMKFTEGAFLDWAYEVLFEPLFSDRFVTEAKLLQQHARKTPSDKLVAKDRIADNMFQQLLLNANEYDVIVTPNLNGDYFSDAAAAAVGGLGMAPGANVGDKLSIFEATHGSAPKYKGLDKVNPTSLILSAAMMLKSMGWYEAEEIIQHAVWETLKERKGTYDLIRGWKTAGETKLTELSCSEYAAALVDHF